MAATIDPVVFIIGAVVFSTVQMQDLYDQAGDKLRGRKSLPFVAGDAPARWMTVVPMGLWCIICPSYRNLHCGIGVTFALLGISYNCSMFDEKVGERRQEDVPIVEPLGRLHVFATLAKPYMELINKRGAVDSD